MAEEATLSTISNTNMSYLQRLRDWHKSSPITKDAANNSNSPPRSNNNCKSYCSVNNNNISDVKIKNVTHKKQKILTSCPKTPGDIIVVEEDDCTVHTEVYPSSHAPPSVKQERVSNMKKWYIPTPAKPTPPEVTLLERIVWVKLHKLYWWPAIVYQNYAEIQQQSELYSQLDMLTRVNIAMIIIQQGEKSKQRICRLLGRPNVELIPVERDSHVCEFYWQLPNVLPKACNSDYFSQHPHLYYDFHRALDQVETILYDFLGQKFALKTGTNCGDDLTWLTRARIAEQAKWAEANPYLADWFECCTGLQVATEPPVITNRCMATNNLASSTKVAASNNNNNGRDNPLDDNNNNNFMPIPHNATSTSTALTATVAKKTTPQPSSYEIVGRTTPMAFGGTSENVWVLKE